MSNKFGRLGGLILTVLFFMSIVYISPASVQGSTVSEVTLYEGWNLIGLPFMPEDPSIEVVLSEIIGYVESVWAFDGGTGTWSSYSPGAPSDLVEMVEGEGYWIKMNANAILTIFSEGYVLRNPSMLEVYDFIFSDKTDENEYVIDEYTCVNFAADFKENAFEMGYLCYYVSLRFPDGGHALVAFNTTDRGLVYIEPQDDGIVEPQIGQILYPEWESPDFNYTTLDILLIP